MTCSYDFKSLYFGIEQSLLHHLQIVQNAAPTVWLDRQKGIILHLFCLLTVVSCPPEILFKILLLDKRLSLPYVAIFSLFNLCNKPVASGNLKIQAQKCRWYSLFSGDSQVVEQPHPWYQSCLDPEQFKTLLTSCEDQFILVGFNAQLSSTPWLYIMQAPFYLFLFYLLA